jgi:hypothetical protein
LVPRFYKTFPNYNMRKKFYNQFSALKTAFHSTIIMGLHRVDYALWHTSLEEACIIYVCLILNPAQNMLSIVNSGKEICVKT